MRTVAVLRALTAAAVSVAALSAAPVGAAPVRATATAWGPSPAAAPSIDPASAEAEFVSRINQLRSSKGLGALAVHGELTGIGRAWAAHMAEEGSISHNPRFSSQVTANWKKLGENVGMGADVAGLHQAFVDSPTHYANLVDGEFTHVGVGVVVQGDTIFTAHQFMDLFDEPAPAPPATAPPATAAPAAPAPPAPTTSRAVPTGPTAPLGPATAPGDDGSTPEAPVYVLPTVLPGLRLLDALG